MSQEEKQPGCTRTPLACEFSVSLISLELALSCYCHIFQQLGFTWCAVHRQHFCWFDLHKLFCLSLSSFTASSTIPPTVGCHLRVREKQGMTETWLFPAPLEPDSLLGKFHRKRWETGGVDRPFSPAFSSGAGLFICCSEALLMQKEHI